MTILLIPNYTIDKKSYNKKRNITSASSSKISVSDAIKYSEKIGCPAQNVINL